MKITNLTQIKNTNSNNYKIKDRTGENYENSIFAPQRTKFNKTKYKDKKTKQRNQ